MANALEGFHRTRPGSLLKFMFKLPPRLYHGPLASLMSSRCVMVLTATGRKSGQPRTNAVSYMSINGNYVSFSGWGVSSNWYRNVVANPDVTLKVGRKTIHATANPVTDRDRRIDLMLRMREQSKHCGPPTFIRPLLRMTHAFDYDNEIQMAVDHAHELPIVEFVPRE